LSDEIGLIKVAMFPGVIGLTLQKKLIALCSLWTHVADSSWTFEEIPAAELAAYA